MTLVIYQGTIYSIYEMLWLLTFPKTHLKPLLEASSQGGTVVNVVNIVHDICGCCLENGVDQVLPSRVAHSGRARCRVIHLPNLFILTQSYVTWLNLECEVN